MSYDARHSGAMNDQEVLYQEYCREYQGETERDERGMKNNSTGSFSAIGREMNEVIQEITDRGNDAEIRKRYDGSYDVFELEKKKPKAAKGAVMEPLPNRG